MDQKKLQDTIAQYYSRLPPQAQAIFGSMAWMQTLQDICFVHNLNPNQIETVGTETTLVLLGIVPMEEYGQTVTAELGLTQEMTAAILAEIEEKILKTIRPTLEEVYTNNVKDIDALQQGDLDPRFALVPENVQKAIAASDYQKKLYEIGTKYKLNVSAMAALEEATVRFITGAISPTRYESDVALGTDLEAGKVKDLAKEVDDTILVDIRKNMQKQDQSSVVQTSTEEDLDVPIPPYAHSPIEQNATVAVPSHIAQQAPTEVPQAKIEQPSLRSDRGILANAGIEIMGVETPTPDSSSIVASKFFGPTKAQAIISDHSLPKVVATPAEVVPSTPSLVAPVPKTADPYHEAIN
jgi:hypothetical protein